MILYSAAVASSVIPGFDLVPNALIIPYYVFIPGYFVMLLLRQNGTLLEGLFYSVAWSVAVFASFSSLDSLLGNRLLPLSILIPAITLALLIHDHYRES